MRHTPRRPVGYAPRGHWKTITFLGGLRQRGLTAPFVLEGAMNGPKFLAYVKQMPCPDLKSGEIVLMDHARASSVGVRGLRVDASAPPRTEFFEADIAASEEPPHRAA